ncbi:unnamed protein product [Dicrocoelium dendriticum]|nr:unnamed protein product [Dicrocoelium dendriticum]
MINFFIILVFFISDDYGFMETTSQSLHAPLTSLIARLDSSHTDSSDYFSSGVYELTDDEEPSCVRSLGYQKPKHMWMAKDKVLTSSLNSSSPSVASPTVEMCNSLCVTGSTCSAVCVTATSSNVSPLPTLLIDSPSPPADLSISPAVPHNAHGLSILPSAKNTDDSSCIPTPPAEANARDPTVCASSNLINGSLTQLSTAVTVDETIQQAIVKPKGRSNRTTKSKRTSVTTPSERPHKTNRRRSIVTGLANVLSTPASSSNNEDNDNASLHSKPVHSRRKRLTRINHSNTVRKDRRNFSKRRLTLTLPLSLLGQPPVSDSASGSPQSDSSSHNDPNSPRSTVHTTVNQSKTINCELPIVSGGLKIRLRRDSAPSDVSSKRNKRCRSKTDISFRIVESWCDTDAPGGDYSRRARAAVSSSSSPSFTPLNGSIRVGDIVWAKLAGYPYWPSRVSAIWARTAHQLSQAILFPSQQLDASSLSVLATPSDPALAAGYTAKVDWLAWDQCSYLSCAKLYPFKETYDKMYNPRTRVKGYAEAVRLAKRFASESQPALDSTESHLVEMSPSIKPGSAHVSAPPSADSQWSTANTLTCSTEPPSSFVSNPPSRDTIEKDMSVASDPASAPTTQVEEKDPFLECRSHSPEPASTLGPESETFDLSVVGDPSNWAPLPQLDVAGLGDFVTHIPTFSEDEDEIESVTSQLRIDFGSYV